MINEAQKLGESEASASAQKPVPFMSTASAAGSGSGSGSGTGSDSGGKVDDGGGGEETWGGAMRLSADELLKLFSSGGLAAMVVNGSAVNVGLVGVGAGGRGLVRGLTEGRGSVVGVEKGVSVRDGVGGGGGGGGVEGVEGGVGVGTGTRTGAEIGARTGAEPVRHHKHTLRRRLASPTSPTPATPVTPVHWDYQVGLHFRCGDRAYTQGAGADLQCQHDGTGTAPHTESDYMR